MGRGSVLQSICLLFSALKWAVSVGLRQVMGQALVTYKCLSSFLGSLVSQVGQPEHQISVFLSWKYLSDGKRMWASVCNVALMVLPSTRRLNTMVRCWNSIDRATSQPVCAQLWAPLSAAAFCSQAQVTPCSVLLNLRPSPECQHVGS